jgi:hypothetical protein
MANQSNLSLLTGMMEINGIPNTPVSINLQYHPSIYKKEIGTVNIVLMTISEDGRVLGSIDKQPYLISQSEDALGFVTKESNQSIQVALTFQYNGILNFSAHFDYSNDDRFLLLNSINFVKSLNDARKLKILDVDKSNIDILDIPSNVKFDVEKPIELVNSIIIIENYTGIKFKIPSEEIPYVEFLKIQVVSKIISTNLFLHIPLKLVMNKEDALKLLKSYYNKEINENSILRYSFKGEILGKDITINDVILNLAAVKPAEKPRLLYESILRQSGNIVSIILVNSVDMDTYLKMHVDSIKKLHIKPSSYEFYFPNSVRSFIKEVNLPDSVLANLSVVIEKIDKFLKDQDVKYYIKTDLYVDREYPDWKEIEVIIGVNKNLKFIYQTLKPRIYEIVSKTITSILLNRILINFQTYDE